LENQDKKPPVDGMEQPTAETLAEPLAEAPEVGNESSAPDLTAEEAVALTGEDEKASQDIDEEPPPPPFDLDGEHIPGPSDNVVPLDSIEQSRNAAQEAEKAEQETTAAEEKALAKKGRGRPPKSDKTEKTPDISRDPKELAYEKALHEYIEAYNKWEGQGPSERSANPPKRPKPPKKEKDTAGGKQQPAAKEKAPVKEEAPAPPEPEQPPVPRDAARNGEAEQIVYINLSELRPFKNHPFGVRDDAEMKALVESVKEGRVNQPAIVRPHPDGNGYEIVAGHRRHMASELADYANMPCIVRDMTDDEAILAMTDDNLRQRSTILSSEKAASLKMQVDAIKRQGARDSKENDPNKGKTVYDIVAERNSDDDKPMSGKQVQRYVKLTELVPDLMKMLDEKQLGFTQAIEFSFIKRKNQNLIAVSIEGEQAKPSLSQAKRLRELDGKGQLNGDIIDGILSEQKKEVDKVIISGAELDKYFSKDKTPREMKDQIMKLLDEWSDKEKARSAPEKPER